MNQRKSAFMMTALFILITIFLASGCSGKKGHERVVASINNYNMTIEDFNYESKEILNLERVLDSMPATREEMLDALITKEILVQEAVKENLDKEKEFMKAIELYWEQTLLKNMLSRKSEEIAKGIVVYENEISCYYENMKKAIKAKVIVFTDEKYARKAMAEKELDTWEKDPEKFRISYVIPPRWYVLGEDQSPREYAVFTLDPVNDRGIVKIDGKWNLIIIEETAPKEIEPLGALREEISLRIRSIKGKEAMDRWIDSLRSKTRINIDEKVLNSIN